MINSYYVLQNGEQTGPYTQYELMDMDVSAHTMVLSPLAGENDWQEAYDLPEFSEYFENKGVYLPTHANLASFWWRLLAYLIDYVIIIILGVVLAALIITGRSLLSRSYNPDEEYSDAFYNLLSVFILVFYHAIFEASPIRGAIGKKICKLAVVDINGDRISFGKALSRNLAKIISSLLFGIGFLKILWSNHRQGLHDELAKTYVVKRP